MRVKVSVVEATEPHSTDVGTESPFSKPDGVLEVFQVIEMGLKLVAVGQNLLFMAVPCHVVVSIQNDVFAVIIIEKIVPFPEVGVALVHKHKKNIGVYFADLLTAIAIVLFENFHIRISPGLVGRLNSIESGVVTVHLHEVGNVVDTPLDLFVIDVVVALGVEVPVTHPVGCLDGSVQEVVLIGPLNVLHLARVIVAVLGSLESVDVKHNLEAILMGSVEEPLNFLSGTVHAANVRAIGGGGPVTDGKADDLNLAVSNVLYKVLSDPSIPMSPHDGISFDGTKGLTESPGVHADTFRVGFSKEAVEEGGSDPGFEDHPTTEVGSNKSFGLDQSNES